jgi:hypothetical protein
MHKLISKNFSLAILASLLLFSNELRAADFYLGLGLQNHSAETEFDENQFSPSESDSALHLGFGFKNYYGDSSQHAFGMGIDIEQILGDRLIGYRALDYKRRIGNKLALGGFFGVASLDSGAPQNGYYAGINLSVNNLIKSADLVLEYRLGNGLSRDRRAGDPEGERPDIFTDFSSTAIYLNWRF